MKIHLITIIGFVVLTSCNKKNTTPVSEPAPSPSVPTPTLVSNGTSNYDGLFEVLKLSSAFNGTYTQPSLGCKALLCSQTVSNEVLSNYIDMGKVKLNNITFSNQQTTFLGTTKYYYQDTTFTNFSMPYIWDISGSGSFAKTTFTSNTLFPTFNSAVIKDSLYKSKGLTISLSSLTGCDFVNVILLGPSGSSYLTNKLLAGSAPSISIAASELTGFTTGNGILTIQMMKDNIQTINGKKVNLRSGISFSNFSLKIVN
jgi:hypothetical protein